jgi:hypothetical protein
MQKAGVIAVVIFLVAGVAWAEDRACYSEGTRPRVLINWQSFEDNGFPSSWKIPFQNVVINAYTRLNRVLGVDIRPQFAGYTNKTNSDPGEIVISANEKHADTNRVASFFGTCPNRNRIVFHRKRGSDLTPWNWTPFWNRNDEISMYGVLMHEMQHTLGLDHNSASKSIMGNYTWIDHHGPWSGDIADIRSQYGFRDDNRLRQLATYDGGPFWSTLSNDISNFNSSVARTTNRIAVAGNSSNKDYVVGWTTPDNRLTWVRGDGVQFDADNWIIYGGGNPGPRYGSAMVSNHGDTWMWAIVDGRNDDIRVRVLRSQDNAASWAYTGFPNVSTASTPGIATTMIDGQRAWVVVWVNYDESDRDNTGFIYASVSFNNGGTWSARHRVDDFYRVHDGVSIAANDEGNCWVTFVWAGEKDDWEFGQNKVRSFQCTISPAGVVTRGTTCDQSQHSRIAPDMVWDSGSGKFVQGIREQDYNTSLDSMQSTDGGCPTIFQHITGSTTHVAPGLASNPAWGNETVMWFARE